MIPPFIIWSNKVHTTGFYGKDGVHREDAIFAISPKEYMNDELGLQYIVKHFDPHTTPISITNQSTPWRLLIVDGHSSHVGYQVVEAALDHGIQLYCLPPHSTHIMQPLNVTCFAPLLKHTK